MLLKALEKMIPLIKGRIPNEVFSKLSEYIYKTVSYASKNKVKNPYDIPIEVIEWAAKTLRSEAAPYILKKAAGIILRLAGKINQPPS